MSTAPPNIALRPLRIVHLISRDFRSLSDGGSIMTASLASALAANGELHIIDMNRHPTAGLHHPDGERLPLPFGGEALFHTSIAPHPAKNRWFSALRHRLIAHARHQRSRTALARTRSLEADVVVADDITGCLVARDSGAPCRVVHTHNIESLLHHDMARQTGKLRFHRKARQYAKWEAQVLTTVEAVWAVSDSDAKHYRQLGIADVRVMPVAFPEDRFEPSPSTGTSNCAIFFGSLWYGPNIDAARYLAKLLPRLRKTQPSARILIAGGRASTELKAELTAAGLELLGFVENLREAAREAAAILVPLAWGGGTKIKTAEALALGKPVISTPEGVRGLDLHDGTEALIRTLGEAFDSAVADALRDPWSNAALAARGQAYARANLSLGALKINVGAAIKNHLTAGHA